MEILSEGKIEGEVILISSKDDLNKDIKGKIIVSKKITLDMLHKLYNVKGIIVEEGTKLSHVALFIREINIPYVRIDSAMKKYKSGEIIKI